MTKQVKPTDQPNSNTTKDLQATIGKQNLQIN